MFDRILGLPLAALAWYIVYSGTALAQLSRAPSKPPDLSLQRLWDLLVAKPGIAIAGAIAIVTVVFVLVTRTRKSRS